jgi:hypothetical protein
MQNEQATTENFALTPRQRPLPSRWFRRALYWLFPPNYDKWPDTMEGRHVVSITTDIFLGWRDRLRILCGGVLRLDTITRSTGESTEAQPYGPMDSTSAIEIRPPFITKRPPVGEVR